MKYALILAGGVGSRAGGSLPKQFQSVNGHCMLWWSLKAFITYDPSIKIIVVLHPDFINLDTLLPELSEESSAEIVTVSGGNSRIESVKKGLNKISTLSGVNLDSDIVFIHDSARPMLTPHLIRRCEEKVGAGSGAVPVVIPVDSLREISKSGSVVADRSNYRIVQTPQTFILRDIMDSYNEIDIEEMFTDDASIAQQYGIDIALVEGDTSNIKVTTPIDFKIAEILLQSRP